MNNINKKTLPLIVCNEFNQNNRIYPKKLIQEKIVDDVIVKEMLNTKSFFIEHTQEDAFYTPEIDMMNVVGAIENIYFKDNVLFADIVSFNDNDIVELYINGVGSVETTYDGTVSIIKDDYCFHKVTAKVDRRTE